jgi:hypothetical protein
VSTAENNALVESNLVQAVGIVAPARSGLMTGIAADADVYALRNVHSTRTFSVGMIRFRWYTTTAFGTAQSMAFRVSKVFGFTAVHSGGTPVACQAHYKTQPHRQTAGTRVPLTELSAVISSTAALTTATYTAPDDDEPDEMVVSSGAVLPVLSEIWRPRDGLPLVLEPNTGIVIKLDVAMGASGLGRLYVAPEGFWQS